MADTAADKVVKVELEKDGPFLNVDLTEPGCKEVTLHTPNGDWVQKKALGKICQGHKGWYIYSLNGNHDWAAPVNELDRRVYFPTAADAAKGVWYIREAIDLNPCPDSIRDYLCRRADVLRDARKHHLIQIDLIQMERQVINSLAKEHKLDLRDTEVSLEKECDDLVKFMDEHNSDLYENMGKDFARSLRAYVAAVVRMVNPDAASRI